MNKIITFLIIFSFATSVFAEEGAKYKLRINTGDKLSFEKTPFFITIRSDKYKYRKGEKIVLSITMISNTDDKIFTLWAFTKKGKFNHETIGEIMVSQDKIWEVSEIYFSSKGERFKHDIELDSGLLSGKVVLRFRYTTINIPINMIPPKGYKFWGGTIISNPISIEVVEKVKQGHLN